MTAESHAEDCRDLNGIDFGSPGSEAVRSVPAMDSVSVTPVTSSNLGTNGIRYHDFKGRRDG